MKGLINKGPRRWGERREPAIRRPDCHGIIVTAARLNFAMHGRDEQLDLGSTVEPDCQIPGMPADQQPSVPHCGASRMLDWTST